jgi:integrase
VEDARVTLVIDMPRLWDDAPAEASTRVDAMDEPNGRRGWREPIEPGLYRAHRVGCPSSRDRRSGRRCGCPFTLVVPGADVGARRQIGHPGPVGEARTERRRLLAAGRTAAPSETAPTQTLHDLARDYFRAIAASLAPSTLKGYEEGYLRSIAPRLGDRDIQTLTREQVEEWIGGVLRDQGRHAAWKALACLRPMLRRAVEWGRIADNPAARIRLPRPSSAAGEGVHLQGSRRILDRTQLAQLIAACPVVRVECMVRLSAEAGLRKGEVIGLRWGDLDLALRRVTVERTVWQGRNEGEMVRYVRPPKSGRQRRVALPDGLVARLADWYAESVISGGTAAEGWVFPGRDGGPMDEGSPNQALDRALRRAGLHDGEGRGLVTWHGLRHGAASHMLAAGKPLTAVAMQLGHADPSITARIYSHLLNDSMLDDAVSAFDAPPEAAALRETLRGDR